MLTRPTRPTRPAPSENATDLVAPDEGAPVLLGEAAEDDEPECDAPDEWAVEDAPAALEEATETEVTGMVEATEPVGDPTSTVKKDAATSSRPVDWTYDWTYQ